MAIRDKIGRRIVKYIYPYMQEYNDNKLNMMPKVLDERNEYLLREKQLWYLGCEDMLADFYQSRSPQYNIVDIRGSYYYTKVNADIRVVHSGIPALISDTKSRLLMSGGVELICKNGEDEDKKNTELLWNIFVNNKADTIIKESVACESWGSRFAWKLSYDKEVTEYPIITMYNPLEYETTYKCGRLQTIAFKNKMGDYCLYEIYGKGSINYKLFRENKYGKKPIEVPLSELDLDLPDISWEGNEILANEKISKSDYKGLVSEFDALDETWSQLMDEIRLARSEVYVPDTLMTSKTFNKFRKNFTVLGTDMDENAKNEIKHVQPAIRTGEYVNAINTLISNMLTVVGLSPFTCGIDDSVGANSSGYSLEKREMSSLRTREEMIKGWEEYLEETLKLILFANSIFTNTTYTECELEVTFGKYITPSQNEVIANTKLLIEADIIDQEKALDEIYGDSLTEEEKVRMITNNGTTDFVEGDMNGAIE